MTTRKTPRKRPLYDAAYAHYEAEVRSFSTARLFAILKGKDGPEGEKRAAVLEAVQNIARVELIARGIKYPDFTKNFLVSDWAAD
jgi:hypothetical protein